MKNKLPGIMLLLLLVFTPLAYGTVQYWSLFIFHILAALFCYFSLSEAKFSPGINNKKLLFFIPPVLFVLYIFIQTIPLPGSIIGFLSPQALESYLFTGFTDNIRVSLSLNRHATYTELMKLLGLVMVFTGAIFYAKSEKKITFILNLILFMGFITALYAIIQGYAFPGYVYGRRFPSPYGTFVNRDHFGGFMGMLVPLSLSQVFISSDKSKKVLYVFISAIIASASVLSLSRGAVISLLVSVIFFSALIFIFMGNKKNNIIFYAAFFILLTGLAFWLDWGPSIERFKMFSKVESGVINPRIDIWKDSLPLAEDYRLFGTGLGTYRYVFPEYQKSFTNLKWSHAHNEYIEMLTDTGIIGVLLLASFFVMFYLRAFITLVRFRGRGRYHLIGLIASSFFFFFHTGVEFLYRITAIPVYFALICGTLYAMGELSKRKSTTV